MTFHVDRARLTEVDFDQFARESGERLRRALVARYGVDIGVEVTADAMAYAWEQWSDVREMTNPTGYLYRVAQSAARRQHRWRLPIVSLPAEAHTQLTPSDPGLPGALANLRPDVRVAVVLVHGYRWSYAEVATLLDVPISTVRNHVHRGTSRLRQQLEEQ